MARKARPATKIAKLGKQYASKPKENEVEIAKIMVDRVVGKRTFEFYDKPTRGARFHIFKAKGEELTGRVISHAIVNIRRNSSYAIENEHGEVVEVFANKSLHKQLGECFGQVVRIVYIGQEQTNWGHAKKIYRVYKEDRQTKEQRMRKESQNGI